MKIGRDLHTHFQPWTYHFRCVLRPRRKLSCIWIFVTVAHSVYWLVGLKQSPGGRCGGRPWYCVPVSCADEAGRGPSTGTGSVDSDAGTISSAPWWSTPAGTQDWFPRCQVVGHWAEMPTAVVSLPGPWAQIILPQWWGETKQGDKDKMVSLRGSPREYLWAGRRHQVN